MSERVIINGVDVTDDATPTGMACPVCGGIVLLYPWWDDSEENGGAVIGDYLRCVVCEWFELR